MKAILNILILVILFTSYLFAQYPQWINYTNGDEIRALAAEGNIVWVGTNGGLVKIDKANETTVFYNKANSGLPTNLILCIAIDASGNKWIGTESGGLIKFDGSHWTVYDTSNSGLPYNTVNCIAIDKNGYKWMGSGEFGEFWRGTYFVLAKFDDNNWTVYDESNSDTTITDVDCIVIDKNNHKWIAAEGLVMFDDNNWTVYDFSAGCIAIDNDNTKWFGTGHGLVKYDGSDWTVYDTSNSDLPYNTVNCIAIDENGFKWMGFGSWAWGWGGESQFHGEGLAKYDGSNWTIYNEDNSDLSSNAVNCIAIDDSDNKWIGTDCLGLNNFDNSNWRMHNTSNSGLPGNQIDCIFTDNDDNMWISIATWNSDYVSGLLVKYDGRNWTVFDNTNSDLPECFISDITIDSNDNKWIGTDFYGLAMFDNNNWTFYNKSNSDIPSNRVSCIVIDSEENKWIGTNDGLARFDGNTWTVYDKSDSLSRFTVKSIIIDSNGNKWIGTERYGLAMFDNNNWTFYNTSNSDIPSNRVNCIVIDSEENKWIGTGGGVARFDGNTWTVYDKSNSGLPFDFISCIAIDENDNKLIGSGGLAVFNQTGIVSVEEKKNVENLLPSKFRLAQNYPNPFNPSTTIEFNLPKSEFVELKVFNILGKEVSTLVSKKMNQGNHTYTFDGKNLASGIYYYQLTAGEYREVKKMILLR